MLIDTCLVSCNLNDFYLDFFPVVNKCWNDICNIRCILILIANEVPKKLIPFKDDIILFPPIQGIHDALVAQLIREIYPCILSNAKGIIMSDIDLIPLNKSFYLDNVKNINDDTFVVYRDVLLNDGQIAMCFNGATSTIWKDVWQHFGFTINNEEDIRILIKHLCSSLYFDGRPGYHGWFTDQLILYRLVMNYKMKTDKVIILKDTENGWNRLDRADTEYIKNNKEDILTEVNNNKYSDYHLPRPWNQYKDFIMYFLSTLLKKESIEMIQNYLS